MDGSTLASDQVIAELLGMGFPISKVTEAVKEVGPSLNNAIEFILNNSCKDSENASKSSKNANSNDKVVDKRSSFAFPSFERMRQSSIVDHLQAAGKRKINKTSLESDVSVSRAEVLPRHVEGPSNFLHPIDPTLETVPKTFISPPDCSDYDIGPDWEVKAKKLLRNYFGYSSLKSFQKEALAAWIDHKDCLVLAATGSGKSLCFQIPALLTGKVVVVISPLISLMHDQCLKLAKHGVSACFLGSGQTDSTVEQKAMRGMYSVIYVCPETVLRLIKSLQGLAESRGIALFAIDEAHCVSKWGHDF